ncbi:metal ABC transporter substrate-binding protein [Thalassolituus sp. LLYu03]|uniref:metal ABC transporter substrate-binding protein n=1 Tax=Thalassolituus sp. LLYu03 TaxID=3421656 RepID=UPI003D29186A
MNTLLKWAALLLPAVAMAVPAQAKLAVFACEPEWAALAQEMGGDQVTVFSATTAAQDPHHIQARPSLIAQVRKADLVFCTGSELEVGWLPMLLRQAGNERVQPGKPGYFEAAAQVETMDKPTRLDRADGDVHPGGNPHIQTDPRNITTVANALLPVLKQLDPASASLYDQRAADFLSRWQTAISRWETAAAPLKGTGIVVHHRSWSYLERWLGLNEIAALEPKPGVPPAPGHLSEVLTQLKSTPAEFVVRADYQDARPANWLSQQAGIPVLALPFTVGGNKEAGDLFALFDNTINTLLSGLNHG